jgi:DNA polymerase elongation subunit (family B)
MTEQRSPRVLFWDIETSLQLAAIFQLANNDWIDPSNLVTERYVICAGWKWEGEDKVHTVSVLDDSRRYAADPHDDYHVIKVLHKVLSEADYIVHHNGDSFDKRYVDTRILVQGMPALPPINSIDTYKVAKSKLMLNSNKLDYIGGLLKVGRKKPTTSGLWLRVLKGDKKAIREMVDYNKQDVLLLERVFYKLRPYMANHVSRELFGKTGCPRCGSKKVQSRGVHRAITRVYQRFQCQNPSCMGWFRLLKGEPGSTKYRVL